MVFGVKSAAVGTKGAVINMIIHRLMTFSVVDMIQKVNIIY